MAGWAGAAGSGLVGRERELMALREALDRAFAGHGGLALIGGEAGLGKTTLAEALCWEAAERGALVLIGRAYDLAETPPYGPWAEALARAPNDASLPALPTAVLPPERDGEALTSQDAIIRRILAYLAAVAATQPLVLLLEDLHWADPASLDLLRVVARSLFDLPLLLLATYRDDELPRDHRLAMLLPALVRESRAERVSLHPLEEAAIGALVATRYALVDADQAHLVSYLAWRTEGNALFLTELLRTLEADGLVGLVEDRWVVGDLAAAPVPTLLRQITDRRVAQLGIEARAPLMAAAVLGHVVPLELWATVSGVTTGDLVALAERAIDARLLAAASDGKHVRFAHALIREALYEGLGALRRVDWHRRAAEALLASPTLDPDAVAYHFQQAGDPRAIGWLVRAGVRARSAVALVSAAERFASAAALLGKEGSHAGECGWLLLLSALLGSASDSTRSLHLLDTVEELARAAEDQPLAIHARYVRGRMRCIRGEFRQGLAEMERELIALEALPGDYRLRSSEDVAQATIEMALLGGERPAAPPEDVPATYHRVYFVHQLASAGRYREALAAGEGIVHAPQTIPSAAAHLGRGNAHAALGRPDEARREHALAMSGQRALGSLVLVEYTAWVELLLVGLPYQADDLAARAEKVAEGAHAWAQALGTDTDATHSAQSGLSVALLEGRWAEAEQLAEAGRASAFVGFFLGAVVALALLARYQGNPARAWEQVSAVHPAGAATAPGNCYFPHGIAALALAADLALDAGDLATADAWIAAHGRWLDWSGAELWQADHHLLQARYARASGDPAAARTHSDAALARATEPRQPLALLAAHRLLGELATDAGRLADASAHLRQALALADACAAPYERALTLLALAELRHAEGRSDAAGAALDAARAILTPLGAAPALAHVAALAARLAPAPIAAARPGGLSQREAEVLGLLAAGRSNGQIAQALCLSPRTVQRHVANAYLKIGAHNKAEATNYALRHGLA